MVSPAISVAAAQKSFARAAIIGLDGEDLTVLRECFAACGIKLAIAPLAQAAHLEHERYQCCAVKLAPGCEIFLEELRRSPVNRNSVLIGAQPQGGDPDPFWSYCFNALVPLPLKLDQSLEALRTTCLLTVRQLRRYVRLPLATVVNAVADGKRLKCISREISAGGLAMSVPPEAQNAKSWMIEFRLPTGRQVRIPGITCWAKPAESMVGVLFDPGNEQRNEVKMWIESFLAA